MTQPIPRWEAHLLGLPPELRNSIWRYALTEPDGIWLPYVDRSWKYGARCFRSIKEPGLLAVSRQVRNETLEMFYYENTFKSRDGNDVEPWLKSIGKKAALISRLHAMPRGPFPFNVGQDWLTSYLCARTWRRHNIETWRRRERYLVGLITDWVLTHSDNRLKAEAIYVPMENGQEDGEEVMFVPALEMHEYALMQDFRRMKVWLEKLD